MTEKFIVRVIRKRTNDNTTAGQVKEETDQIYEQEFSKLDIGEFAVSLNRKDGQEKDEKSIKLNNQ